MSRCRRHPLSNNMHESHVHPKGSIEEKKMVRASMRPPRPASGYHSATVTPYLFLSHFFLHPPSVILLPSDRVPPSAYKKNVPLHFLFVHLSVAKKLLLESSPFIVTFSSNVRIIIIIGERERGGCASIQPGNREEFIRSNWKLNWMYYNEWNNRRQGNGKIRDPC